VDAHIRIRALPIAKNQFRDYYSWFYRVLSEFGQVEVLAFEHDNVFIFGTPLLIYAFQFRPKEVYLFWNLYLIVDVGGYVRIVNF
jgi:hypothetical protein